MSRQYSVRVMREAAGRAAVVKIVGSGVATHEFAWVSRPNPLVPSLIQDGMKQGDPGSWPLGSVLCVGRKLQMTNPGWVRNALSIVNWALWRALARIAVVVRRPSA